MSAAYTIVFIVGNSRSGATMMGRVLGNHSWVHTFGELHFFEQQVDAQTVVRRPAWPRERLVALLERLLTASREGLFQKVMPGRYGADIERILASAGASDPVSVYAAFLHYETKKQGKVIPCEQTPRYLFFAREILDDIPGAHIVNMVRDPRDVLLSQKNKCRRRFLGVRNIPLREALRAWVNYHPYTIARLWVSAVRAARRMDAHPRFVSIRFKDLLHSPDTIVRAVCDFLDLPFEPRMLEVPQVGSSTRQDRPENKGIDPGRSGNWRKGGLSTVELAICKQVASEDMRRLAYTLEKVAVPWYLRSASMSIFAFKALLGLVLNLHRTRNLKETLRRRLGSGEGIE